jgi:hypothetical protein
MGTGHNQKVKESTNIYADILLIIVNPQNILS